MGADDPWGAANLDPRGWLAEFMLRTAKHRYIFNLRALGLMVSDKIFEGPLAI